MDPGLDDYGELAAIAHDLAIWFETHDIACPLCGIYPRHDPESPCAVSRAVEYRRRIVSTV